MDGVWEVERMKLYQLIQGHPTWSSSRLAEALQHSLSWVKKWRQRFRQAEQVTATVFQSQSRAPKSRRFGISEAVRETILSLRDQLKDVYRRVVGARPILYHLHQDTRLQQSGEFLPRSSSTIWRVLKEGGRIPTRIRWHYPVERPAPLEHWEMDFGQLADQMEFLTVVDRGTSLLVDTQTTTHFHAENALLAVVRLLQANGCLQRLRFDRDTRWVSSWGMDGYLSPLLRFLLCLGIQPDPTPPRRPDLKPFVERRIRSLKYECLWPQRPATPEAADGLLRDYRHFYNHERAHQASVCDNQPPAVAFPKLPILPPLPTIVDPDA